MSDLYGDDVDKILKFQPHALTDGGTHPYRNKTIGGEVPLTLNRYHNKKYIWGGVQMLIALLFLITGIMLIWAAIEESNSGHIPHVFASKMQTIITIIVYSVIMVLLWLSYVYTGFQYSKDGEGQLDNLLSNALSMMAIAVVGIFLMCTYSMTDMNDSNTLKRIRNHIYVFGTSQCVWVVIIFVTSMNRLTSTEHTPVNFQLWELWHQPQHPLFSKGGNGKQTFFVKHFINARWGRWIYTFFITIFVVPELVMGWWMTVKDCKANGLIFNDVFRYYLIVMSVFLTLLIFGYIYWNMNIFYSDFHQIFRVHFDHFFITNALPVLLILLCLLSYHHNYTSVHSFHGLSLSEFQSIKTTHMSSIVDIFLCLLPFAASGIGRSICIFINLIHINNDFDSSSSSCSTEDCGLLRSINL